MESFQDSLPNSADSVFWYVLLACRPIVPPVVTLRETPAVVVNRVQPVHYPSLEAERALGEIARAASRDLEPHTASTLLARLGAAHRRLVELAVQEEEVLARLERAVAGGPPLWRVPRLEWEVNDVPTLRALAGHLFR